MIDLTPVIGSATMARVPIKLGTRAIERIVPAGTMLNCKHCERPIKFSARVRNKQVICNCYEGDKWNRIEHFHPDCYAEAGAPYGEVDISTSDALIKQRRPPSDPR